jgi:hypothetical protein
MKRPLLAVALMCIPAQALAQVTVQLSPVAHQQFLDNSGRPLAGGFVYSYAAGTSTPQATYADSTGTIQNTNPLQLDGGGFGTIWISQLPYKICVANSSNVQQWCVDNVTSGANLLVLTNLWTNPQTWQALGTFTAGLAVAGGLTTDTLVASGGIGVDGAPASFSGGINGNPGWALAVSNTNLLQLSPGAVLIAGTVTATQGIFTAPIGVPPIQVGSSTNVPNLNASFLSGNTFDSPGPIGDATPSTGVFTQVSIQNAINGGCVQSNGGLLNVPIPGIGCNNPAVQSLTTKVLPGNVDLPANTLANVDSQTVTMPAVGCPCRVVISYTYFWETVSGSGADNINLYVTDGAGIYAPSQGSASNAATTGGLSATQTTSSYANSANVTFTVKAEAAQHQQIDAAGIVIGTLKSYLELKVETSL